MRDFIKKYPILSFYTFACLISWIIWRPLFLGRQGFPYQHYIGSIGPALAAIIVQSDIKKFFKDLFIIQSQLKWIVIGLLLPFLFIFNGVLFYTLIEGEMPDISGVLRIEEFQNWPFLTIFLFQTLTFGLGEELGWRGFLLPELQKKNSVFVATVKLTFFWAIWHLPAFFFRPSYMSMDAAEIVGWFLSLFAGAIILTWLFNSSKGSILTVILFHASTEIAFMSDLAKGSMSTYVGSSFMIFALLLFMMSKLFEASETKTNIANPS